LVDRGVEIIFYLKKLGLISLKNTHKLPSAANA
jgi:hypothetical protein